jgi:hypothetical protein
MQSAEQARIRHYLLTRYAGSFRKPGSARLLPCYDEYIATTSGIGEYALQRHPGRLDKETF